MRWLGDKSGLRSASVQIAVTYSQRPLSSTKLAGFVQALIDPPARRERGHEFDRAWVLSC